MTPPIPANKTRSTFKTKTHQGGGFNELRFEDKAGEEEIFLHAEKDRNEKTRNNHTERIDNNWVQSVGGNKVIEVDENHNETILGSASIHVGRSGQNRVLNKLFRKLTEGIGEIGAILPIPGIRGFGSGVLSIFADEGINEMTTDTKTQFIDDTKSTTVGKNISYHAGHSIQATSRKVMTLDAASILAASGGKAVNIRSGSSEIFMSSDGYIRLSGQTLYLKFSNGVEIEGGKSVAINAGKLI